MRTDVVPGLALSLVCVLWTCLGVSALLQRPSRMPELRHTSAEAPRSRQKLLQMSDFHQYRHFAPYDSFSLQYSLASNTTARIMQSQLSSPTNSEERSALQSLFEATGGLRWTNNANWTTTLSYCTWHGVTCSSDGHVTRLDIRSNHLMGTLPAALGQLHHLTWVDWSLNAGLSGTLPPELFATTNLTQLRQIYCSISGTIPDTVFSRKGLSWLALGGTRISGTLSPRFGELPLQALGMSFTQISGTLPESIYTITSLVHLTVNSAFLSGTVSPALANLQRLQHLDLGNNSLSGPFPMQQIVSLPSLVMLTMSFNHFMPGSVTVPRQLHWPNMTIIDFTHSVVVGDVMPLFALPAITALLIAKNSQITGETSKIFAAWPPTLLEVDLNECMVTGTIPSSICPLKIQGLTLSGSGISGTIPHCLYDTVKFLSLYKSRVSGRVMPVDQPVHAYPVQYLNVYDNPWLEGEILFRNLRSVVSVVASGTRISGTVEAMPTAQHARLSLGGTRISGTISASLFDTPIVNLELQDTLVSGMPATIRSPWLVDLLTSNTPMEGVVPRFEAPRLKNLLLGGSSLSGTLSPDFFHLLPSLQLISLAGNLISSTIPTIPSSSQLVVMSLRQNMFEGRLPRGLFNLSSLAQVDLSYNFLEDELALPEHVAANKTSPLSHLFGVYLQGNHLHGRLPTVLPQLPRLQQVELQLNEFSCAFPSSWVSGGFGLLNRLNVLAGSLLECPLPAMVDDLDPFAPAYECASAVLLSVCVLTAVMLVLVLVAAVYYRRKRMAVSLASPASRRASVNAAENAGSVHSTNYGVYLRFSVMVGGLLFALGFGAALVAIMSQSVYECPSLLAPSFIGIRRLSSGLGLALVTSAFLWSLLYWHHRCAKMNGRLLQSFSVPLRMSLCRRVKYILIVLVLLLVLGVGPNVGYVFAILSKHSSARETLVLRVALALYKLAATQLLLPYICQRVGLFQDPSQQSTASDTDTSLLNQSSKAMHQTRIVTMVTLVVSFIAPIISVLLVHPSCLYHRIMPPATEPITFVFPTCSYHQWSDNTCSTFADTDVTEEVPFRFRYLDACPDAIAQAYIPVFGVMFLGQLGLTTLYQVVRGLYEQPPQIMFDSLITRLPAPIQRLLFSKRRFLPPVLLAQDNINITVAATFGLVYPPLISLAFLTVSVSMWTRRLLLPWNTSWHMLSQLPWEFGWIPALTFVVFVSLFFLGSRLRHQPWCQLLGAGLGAQLLVYAALQHISRRGSKPDPPQRSLSIHTEKLDQPLLDSTQYSPHSIDSPSRKSKLSADESDLQM